MTSDDCFLLRPFHEFQRIHVGRRTIVTMTSLDTGLGAIVSKMFSLFLITFAICHGANLSLKVSSLPLTFSEIQEQLTLEHPNVQEVVLKNGDKAIKLSYGMASQLELFGIRTGGVVRIYAINRSWIAKLQSPKDPIIFEAMEKHWETPWKVTEEHSLPNFRSFKASSEKRSLFAYVTAIAFPGSISISYEVQCLEYEIVIFRNLPDEYKSRSNLDWPKPAKTRDLD